MTHVTICGNCSSNDTQSATHTNTLTLMNVPTPIELERTMPEEVTKETTLSVVSTFIKALCDIKNPTIKSKWGDPFEQRTIKKYEYYLSDFKGHLQRNRGIGIISPMEYKDYIVDIVAKSAKDSNAHNERISAMKSFFKYAQECGHIKNAKDYNTGMVIDGTTNNFFAMRQIRQLEPIIKHWIEFAGPFVPERDKRVLMYHFATFMGEAGRLPFDDAANLTWSQVRDNYIHRPGKSLILLKMKALGILNEWRYICNDGPDTKLIFSLEDGALLDLLSLTRDMSSDIKMVHQYLIRQATPYGSTDEELEGTWDAILDLYRSVHAALKRRGG